MTTSGRVEPVGILLTERKVFQVPDFQRSYAWEDPNIDAFHEDIKRAYEADRRHFLGALILREVRNPFSMATAEVIDGQQRLSTIFMYLSILRDRIAELPASEQSVQPKSGGIGIPRNLYQEISGYLFVTPEELKPRFESNYLLKRSFNDFILADPIVNPDRPKFRQRENFSTLKLRKAYARLEKHIDDFLVSEIESKSLKRNEVLNGLFEVFKSKLDLLTIYTESLEEAFDVFMTMNNRGLTLGPSDLVKSLFMKHVASGKSEKEAIESYESVTTPWTVASENLETSDINQFLRHYLLATKSNQVQGKEIFKNFEELLDLKVESGEARDLGAASKNVLSQIVKKSDVYKQLVKPSQIGDEEIREYAVALHALLDSYRVAMMNLLDEEVLLDRSQRRELSRLVEVLSLKWIVAGMNAQELEKNFAIAAKKLTAKEKDLAEQVSDFEDFLVSLMPGEQTVKARFQEEIDSSNLVRVVLHRINEVMTGHHRVLVAEPTKLNVEHIAPQSPTDHWHTELVGSPLDQSISDARYRSLAEQWGNKTILEFKINSALKQAEWDKKRNGYVKADGSNVDGFSRSQANITSQLIGIENWNSKVIMLRGEWLAECFIRIWALNPAESIESFPAWLASRSEMGD